MRLKCFSFLFRFCSSLNRLLLFDAVLLEQLDRIIAEVSRELSVFQRFAMPKKHIQEIKILVKLREDCTLLEMKLHQKRFVEYFLMRPRTC